MPELDIVTAFQCDEGSRPIKVRSSSDPDKVYTVVPGDEETEPSCTCRGYRFRGTCKHLKEAIRHRCGWHSIYDGSPAMTDVHKTRKICPRCGGRLRVVRVGV